MSEFSQKHEVSLYLSGIPTMRYHVCNGCMYNSTILISLNVLNSQS